MASVTGYTAQRMKSIEDNTVVSGSISGDNLILTKYNGTTITAGNVRGATGATGATGDVSLAMLKAAVPAGEVIIWLFAATPSGWLPLEGQTVTSASTLYPDLWAAAPTAWKSGTSLIMPDLRGRFMVGQNTADASFDVLLKKDGTKNLVAVAHNHAIDMHSHGIPDHNHNIDTHVHTTADHTHTVGTDSFQMVYRAPAVYADAPVTGQSYDTSTAMRDVGSAYTATRAFMWLGYQASGHTHTLSNASAGNTTNSQTGAEVTRYQWGGTSAHVPYGDTTGGNTGGLSTATGPVADGINANLPPYFTVRFLMRAY